MLHVTDNVKLRFLTPDDAGPYGRLCLALDRETDCRLYGPGERPNIPLAFERELRLLTERPRSCVIGAEDEKGILIGCLTARGHEAPRTAHRVTVALGIRQSHTGQGLGGRLLDRLEEWARERQILRIELTVSVDNERAIRLYTRHGFQYEGRRKNSLKIRGLFIDEFYMAKELF